MNLMNVRIDGDGKPDVQLTAVAQRALEKAGKVLAALGMYDGAAKEVALALESVRKKHANEEAK